MNKFVTDTQAIIKFINGQKVISPKITSIFKDTDKGKNIVIIPSIVLFEIGYLYEKSRIPVSINDMENIIRTSVNYIEEKLSIDIIKAAFEISDIPELHDRLIAGTARYLDIPLITNDPVILKSRFVKTVQ